MTSRREPISQTQKSQKELLVPPRYEGEFAHGAIVRIQLHNFMAFEDMDIYPGPGINLLLGTNGSGKSSIIAAIGLCLGVPPTLIIRQSKYKQYIRNGTKGASIKITLQDKPLLKIHCFICDNTATWKKKQNKYSWENIERTDLDNLMRGLGIHVDNLCMYLPQERVKEFACLSPEELLTTTLEVIGQELNNKLAEMKIEKKKIDYNKEEISKLQKEMNKNQSIMDQYKADVDRMNQVDQHKRMKRLIEIREKEIIYKENKREYHECRRKVRTFIPTINDFNEKLNERKRSYDDLKIRNEAAASEVQLAEREVSAIKRKPIEFSDFNREMNNKIFRETEKLRRFQQESASAKHRVDELEEKIKRTKILSKEDRKELEQKRDELKEKSRQIQIEIKEDEVQKQTIREKETHINQKMAQLNRQVASAHSRKTAMLDKIREFGQLGQNVMKLYDYLKNYSNVFKGEVIGPICIEITFKDQIYAKYFESSLERDILLCFLCETIEDRQELQTYCKVNKLDKVSFLRRTPKEPWKCDLDIKSLGFDGFLIDFIEAPPIIMTFLSQFGTLDRIPIALKPIDQDLEQIDKMFLANGISRYYISGTHYNIRKSRYSNNLTLLTYAVRPAFLFRDSANSGFDLDKLKKKMKSYEAKLRVLNEEKREIQSRKHKLPSKELGRITNALKEDAQNRSELSHNTDMLERLRANLRTGIDRPIQVKQKREDLLRQKGEALVRYADCLRTLAKEIQRLDAKKFVLKKVEEEFSKVHREILCIKESLEAVRKESSEYTSRIQVLKPLIDKSNLETKDIMIEIEDTETYQSLPTDLEQLKNKLAEYEQRLRVIAAIPTGAKEKFDQAKEAFKLAERKYTELEDSVKESDQRLKADLSMWQNAVQQKVRVLSDAFTKLMEDCGFNGFVMFNKTPKDDGFDLSKFRLDLNVSFKKGAQTVQLVSTRQSGGEKSVATLMYLLALQSCNSFPFRVIDEINQGMDEQNEVITFTRAMECAVEQNESTQYFLVSPKLHQNLKMPESTTVLIVMSGPTIDPISRPVMVHEYSRGFTQNPTQTQN